ncbi:hypothetical protein DT073_06915 [Microbacterium sp. ABRD28]|nr:hypothetical protein DT073_06915 [Microbacterium sp. ABRD28]
MTESQISSFLRARVPTCQAGYVCLKDFTQTTTSRPSDAYCGAYQGAVNEPAARIIAKVAQACGINPQVLLVTLQKEQGLVTHTWPSEWRYTIAMGQGCPDTAACDTRYYGFQNQVYGAARQFQVYGKSSYFTWYAPGKTWDVLYNPNRSCGSSRVYIENQATANLYYYTPYQPNGAALRAGYGTGDGCSSYGNRNFFNYFTDWFGSTQIGRASIVKAPDRAAMYLVTRGTKHLIPNEQELSIFLGPLGGYATVAQQYVDALPTGRPATRYVRDTRDGAVMILDAAGTKHWVQSFDTARRYGYAPDGFLELDPVQLDRYRAGAPVGDLFRADSSPDYFKWEAGQRRYVVNDLAFVQAASATSAHVVAIPSANVTSIPLGRPLLASGSLVKEAGSAEVYVVGASDEIMHIPSFALAAEAGATGYRVVPDGTLASYRKADASLALLVQCPTATYMTAGGALVKVDGLPVAMTAAPMPEGICSALPKSATTVSAPIFVKTPASPPIYVLDQGRFRHVRDQQRLQELNGSRPLQVLELSTSTLQSVGVGAPLLSDRALVRFGGPDIYVVERGELRYVPDSATLFSIAGTTSPAIEDLPREFESAYIKGAPLPAATQ